MENYLNICMFILSFLIVYLFNVILLYRNIAEHVFGKGFLSMQETQPLMLQPLLELISQISKSHASLMSGKVSVISLFPLFFFFI